MIESRMARLVALLCLVVAAAAGPVSAADVDNDAFIRGYATAVLEREFNVDADALKVSDGVVTVAASGLNEAQRRKLVETLSSIDGVKRVDVAAALAEPTPVPDDDVRVADDAIAPVVADRLPVSSRVFDALLADPRWPHMSASYHYYDNHSLAREVGAVSFGGRGPLFEGETDSGDLWELCLQAGVFAAFDLASDSLDLLNADYFVGPALALRRDDASMLLRLFHQSSHLGDELLLNNPSIERENLSFEAVDVILSRDFCDRTVRVYGGGRFRFDLDPGDLDHWSTQYGAEWRSSRVYADGLLRPIAAADLQHHQQNDWEADLSVRAGVQIEHPSLGDHVWQILAEYYNGHSPHGQFYVDRVEYAGVGVHFYY